MNDRTPPPMPPYPSWGDNDPNQANGNGYGNGYGNGQGNPYGNGYGHAQGNAYGNGFGNAQGNAYGNGYGNSPTTPMVQGTGKPKVFDAFGWGLKTTFKQPSWMGFTFLAGFILMILMSGAFLVAFVPMFKWLSENPDTDLSLMPADIANPSLWPYYIVTSLCIAVFVPLFTSAALKSVDGQQVTFGDFFRPRNALWTFITIFVGYLAFLFVYDAAFSTTQQGFGDAATTTSLAAESNFTGGFLALPLLALVMPLIILIPSVWQDTGCSFIDGIKTGVTTGARNYLPLLGFYLLFGLISAVAVIPLGLGMIIVAPAQALATAFVYRQATGGIHPQP